MANTAEGLRFVESCKNRLFLEERPAAEAVEGNSQLSEPVRITKERTDFRSDYKKRGFVRAAKRYVYEKKRRNSALDKIAFVKRTVKKLVPFLNG